MELTAKFVSALLAAGVAGILPAKAEGDAAAGKKVFNKCMACHDAKTDKNKVGPSLMTVVGRKAGTLESYLAKYSDNMKEAGAGGLVVGRRQPRPRICSDPKAVIPKGKMAFPGLKDDADIANVIAYLKADPKP